MPAIAVVLSAMNAGASGPMICRPSVNHKANAYSMVPVPSVAMKESICAISTRMPLMRPTKLAQRRTTRIAIGHGTPNLTCSPIARMCHMTMPKPTVRSMRPAIIGIVAARDRSAMIALSARMERKFR